MNYHIFIDHWFVDDFIATAEEVNPGNNTFLVTSDLPWRQVHSKSAVLAPIDSPELANYFAGIKTSDRVYVHWFEPSFMKYINTLPKEVELYLIFWGGDFLSKTKAMLDFNHDPLTREYVAAAKKKIRNPIMALRGFRARIIQERNSVKVRRQFMSRLNYFCHWNPFDMGLVTASFGGDPKFLHFYYGGGLEKIPGPAYKARGDAVQIWLGNSDTTPNNHLDAMEMLARFKQQDIAITCPLNYGNVAYADFISAKGEKVFGAKWRSIRNMLPLPEYLKAQEDADVVIMNHNRSQGSGNIIAFLKMGKKLYLKKQSSIYALLKEKGMKIFDVDDLNHLSFEEFSRPLTWEESVHNSRLISDLFSVEGKIRGFELILKR